MGAGGEVIEDGSGLEGTAIDTVGKTRPARSSNGDAAIGTAYSSWVGSGAVYDNSNSCAGIIGWRVTSPPLLQALRIKNEIRTTDTTLVSCFMLVVFHLIGYQLQRVAPVH